MFSPLLVCVFDFFLFSSANKEESLLVETFKQTTSCVVLQIEHFMMCVVLTEVVKQSKYATCLRANVSGTAVTVSCFVTMQS
jgi:hypothetical protein